MVAKVVGELNVDGVRWELENVVRWLSGAVGDETAAAHDVERELFRKVLELGRQLFGAFLSAIGNGDRGAEVTVSNTSASLDASPRAEASASLDPDDSPRKTRKATEVRGREEVAFAQMPLVRPTRC